MNYFRAAKTRTTTTIQNNTHIGNIVVWGVRLSLGGTKSVEYVEKELRVEGGELRNKAIRWAKMVVDPPKQDIACAMKRIIANLN